MNMIETCREQLSKYEIVEVSRVLMFIFTEDKTLAITPFHIFMITYNHRNYSKRLKNLKREAKAGNIKNVSDLIDYNGISAGTSIGQFDGLEMTRMELSWIK